MKGDFSRWNFDRNDNFAGILHQQGRVLLDSDWNAQTHILNHWQDTAGQDVIGVGVAAVPAETPDAVKVTQAEVVNLPENARVKLTLFPGRIWADGLLVYLDEDKDANGKPIVDADGKPIANRIATYLQPPIQNPSADESAIADNIRDAVILEVWREAINGFQLPDTLIEPALGGPDTTERVHTAMALRLYRLAAGETCESIRTKLQDDFSKKGKLTVSLQPTSVTDGDCPVVKGGGYTGFEHYLYRVEVAQVTDGTPMFKWSQFNGGLVGRGVFPPASGGEDKVTITANLQPIITSELNEFYLEALEYDANFGHWRVVYGAKATLNDANELVLGATMFGELPTTPPPPTGEPPKTTFFRLWNGIEEIGLFPVGTPKELRDGIRLEFEASSLGKYVPGDYWTFPVRAGEFGNPPILIKEQPPEGIHYHRVPLAELNWNNAKKITFDAGQIEDCRKPFRPLTNQKGCCSFTVGDGKTSQGDFNSIEEALRHLPPSGGKICLLPGLHETNVRLKGKRNIKIEGCGKQTRVVPRKGDREAPIFHIIDSECIALLDMDLVTLGGTAIVLEGTEVGNLKEIEIARHRIIAYKEAIHVKRGLDIHIHHNKIRMLDKAGAGVAIYLMAEDSLIERNDIGVVPAERTPRPERPDGGETPDPTDPCADLEIMYLNISAFINYTNLIWAIRLLFTPQNPFKALGGIQIAGGSERVKVWENEINGGAGNGIALSSSLEAFLANLEAGTEEEEQLIEHKGGLLWGKVVFKDTGLKGITVLSESQDGKTFPAQTDDNGNFSIPDVEAGEYTVSIATPSYKIEDITTLGDGEIRIGHRISVVEEEIDLDDLLAFMYEITIARNCISLMGLSGIGIPRVTLPDRRSNPRLFRRLFPFIRSLASFGNPIIDFSICNNRIFDCWRNLFADDELRSEAKNRGFGGISLGVCANLLIRENRIEDNGTSHIKPTCGIFLSYGERVEIAENLIINNGAISSNTSTNLEAGRRGGIIAIVSSLSILSPLSETNSVVSLGKPAARIDDNNVDQPAGQALGLAAVGAISITNNHFNSELSGIESLERLVGAVLILNFGGFNRTQTPVSNTPVSPFSGTSSTNFARNPESQLRLLNGNILFNSNQTRLGFSNNSLTSQWIATDDDLGFDGNQSDALGNGFPTVPANTLLINTVLLGATLRASDSRFKEVKASRTSVKVSLWTVTIRMNNTSHNQGDHCISVFNDLLSHPAIEVGNQVFDATYCSEIRPTPTPG